MTVSVLRGNALELPLADGTVDLVVTSPPYFGLRSYQDGCPTCDGPPDSCRVKTCSGCGETTSRVKCHNGCGVPMRWVKPETAQATDTCPDCHGTGKGHYTGQLGSEATPAEFVDALLAATAEMVRVVKGSGSIWVNLGDKYAGSPSGPRTGGILNPGGSEKFGRSSRIVSANRIRVGEGYGVPTKSLIGIPWRYALRCIDELGLILRAEVIWSKPNGLPESVTDRVRRSHEQWFHFVREPRYFSAVDEIREGYAPNYAAQLSKGQGRKATPGHPSSHSSHRGGFTDVPDEWTGNPLGKLPGSVWSVPTQPLTVPAWLGVDHFAAFPMEWPRRLVAGWSPGGVCVGCGEGRRPVTIKAATGRRGDPAAWSETVMFHDRGNGGIHKTPFQRDVGTTITGYACACPDTAAPTVPAVVLDPFGGTGTTALVAHVMGRHGISVDLSGDYSRLAAWRTTDPGQLAAAAQVDKPVAQVVGQGSLFEGWPA